MKQEIDLLVPQPVRMRRHDRAPRPVGQPIELAPLHGERSLGGVAVTADDLEPGADQVIERGRNEARSVGRHRAGHQELPVLGLLDRLHRRGVPDHRHGRGRDDAADPGELDRIELARAAQHLAERQRVEKHAERGAVLRRDAGHITGSLDAAAAQHGLEHDRRIARNVAREIGREHAGIEVVAAARRETDIEADALAAIEIGDRIGERRCLSEKHRGADAGEPPEKDAHRISPQLKLQ